MAVLSNWHFGAMAYRRRYTIVRTERFVPFIEGIALEFDRYMEVWLERRATEEGRPEMLKSPWLFPSPRDPMSPLSAKDQIRLLAFGE